MSEPRSDPAIVLEDIAKIYRLYQKPLYRVLDLFGFCPKGPSYYTEHAALKGINLTIDRGEKVAIIGRNGAGKSTLLKVITGATTPTCGSLKVDGELSALLQIGTGNPDEREVGTSDILEPLDRILTQNKKFVPVHMRCHDLVRPYLGRAKVQRVKLSRIIQSRDA